MDPSADRAFMAKALALAERGRGRTSPNPMVGAIIVDDDGVIVGRGAHEFAGGPHAEAHALAAAGQRARGATLYCTLEPCYPYASKRTAPCAPALAAAGIRRAVVAVEDPNPNVRGRGLDYLRDHGIELTVGVEREAAERLNRGFFSVKRRGRPFVTIKAALSRDGKVAAAPGARTAITSAVANDLIHRERAEIDAIAIGSGTLLTDDPVLTARVAYRQRPLTRVVFDRRLRTPACAAMLKTREHGPIIVVTHTGDAEAQSRARALENAGAIVERIEHGGDAFLEHSLVRLAARDVTTLVVEGGPTLHEAFWRRGLVDRVQLFIAPLDLGRDGVGWMMPPRQIVESLDDVRTLTAGPDVLIEGVVRHD
jgi:diaminohydroxyphosphoribosylaminopyrimidine deaminase/5-amino-6-(5-phosphoribosylamino)uracil reductase